MVRVPFLGDKGKSDASRGETMSDFDLPRKVVATDGLSVGFHEHSLLKLKIKHFCQWYLISRQRFWRSEGMHQRDSEKKQICGK